MAVGSAIRRHPGRTAAIAAALVGLGAFAIYWFGPQYLFIDRRVSEAVPTVGAAVDSPGPAGGAAAGPVILAEGEFVGLEHDSSGRAAILELPDGSRYLRLEELDTSNGPDLRVYLSDAPASDDWYVYDDGEFLDLGALKGNMGSSNYEIAAGVDLSRYESAVVWCRRFSVGFAVAPLEPAG
jgi:hypothetical protein